jgi:hypothetical protein
MCAETGDHLEMFHAEHLGFHVKREPSGMLSQDRRLLIFPGKTPSTKTGSFPTEAE